MNDDAWVRLRTRVHFRGQVILRQALLFRLRLSGLHNQRAKIHSNTNSLITCLITAKQKVIVAHLSFHTFISHKRKHLKDS